MERDPKAADPACETPDPEALAELLRERYPVSIKDKLSIHTDAADLSLRLEFVSGDHAYTFSVAYLRGAGPEQAPWMLAIDALDALFGAFLESGRNYRELPNGDDVQFSGAFFRVRIDHTILSLARAADALFHPSDP